MIKGFLFDYDGVVTSQSKGNSPSELLGRILSMNPEDVGQLFMSFWPDYLRGKISETDLWEMIEARTGTLVSPEQRQIWTKWEQLRPEPEMVSLIKDLRERGYPVGLLTNVTPTTEEEVRTQGGYDGFDFLVRSCKVGYAKPDEAIYQLALEQFPGLRPEEVVFIDDKERFLSPAQALGMQVILAKNTRQIIDDVKRIANL